MMNAIGVEPRTQSTFLAELKYAFYLIFHPFKGFWEIKREGKGSVRTATILLIMYLAVTVVSGLFTGYLFRAGDALDFSIPKEIFKVMVLFFSYCIANWCFTCLFDGEGTFRDIYKSAAYALLPHTVILIILLPLSNFFILTESTLYSTLSGAAMVWTLFLIFAGMLVTHQYTPGKTVISAVCTVLGMCIFAYIGLLFFNLMQQVIGFVATIIQEAQLRSV